MEQPGHDTAHLRPPDECEAEADIRDRAADERDRRADERDHTADEREQLADLRDRRADERESLADDRDRAAALWDEAIRAGDRVRALIVNGERKLLASAQRVARSRDSLHRRQTRSFRSTATGDAEVERPEREQAEVDRETAAAERAWNERNG